MDTEGIRLFLAPKQTVGIKPATIVEVLKWPTAAEKRPELRFTALVRPIGSQETFPVSECYLHKLPF
jgi:hypothetical protein